MIVDYQYYILFVTFIMIVAYFICRKYGYLNEDLEDENNKIIQKKEVVSYTQFDKKMSKFEKKVKLAVLNLTREKFVSVRPNWLKNPVTNRNLELDLFNENLNLAFEIQGIQHYKFSTYFYKTYSDFKYQQLKDEYKKLLCKNNDITLVEIPYWVETNDGIYDYIYEKLLSLNKKNLYLYYEKKKYHSDLKKKRI